MSQDRSIADALKDKNLTNNLVKFLKYGRIKKKLAASTAVYNNKNLRKDIEDMFNKSPHLLSLDLAVGKTKSEVIKGLIDKFTSYVKR